MHYTTRKFWQYYDELPESVQRTADECYELLKVDPSHPSLHFKRLGKKYWSVRAGLSYRALGVEVENGISWFWIGTHAEYDKLIGKLQHDIKEILSYGAARAWSIYTEDLSTPKIPYSDIRRKNSL